MEEVPSSNRSMPFVLIVTELVLNVFLSSLKSMTRPRIADAEGNVIIPERTAVSTRTRVVDGDKIEVVLGAPVGPDGPAGPVVPVVAVVPVKPVVPVAPVVPVGLHPHEFGDGPVLETSSVLNEFWGWPAIRRPL